MSVRGIERFVCIFKGCVSRFARYLIFHIERRPFLVGFVGLNNV